MNDNQQVVDTRDSWQTSNSKQPTRPSSNGPSPSRTNPETGKPPPEHRARAVPIDDSIPEAAQESNYWIG